MLECYLDIIPPITVSRPFVADDIAAKQLPDTWPPNSSAHKIFQSFPPGEKHSFEASTLALALLAELFEPDPAHN